MFKKLIALILLSLAVYWSFDALLPNTISDIDAKETSFSTQRALIHLKEISKKEHYLGNDAHSDVRAYIVNELKKLGLETQIQEGYSMSQWGNLSKPKNILTKIKGTDNSKAILLLTHYDSNPHSSFGASDAGSGVVTILEGIRAFLSENKTPKNDIIILISDGEELGLNGADIFVNKHPWAKDVGLVLNFEARGSGGPSYMLIETNQGNANLMKEFVKANPQFPVANSLAYSIYKMLPNDTDLTRFRADADIDGFNFAFIDDHYDYHTANDTYDNLDVNTLQHQGEYLLPLVHYFGDSDLNQLKSLDDHVYINLPFFKMVSYPFTWVFPMLLVAIVLFIGLIIYGLRKRVLTGNGVVRGFIPFTLAMIFCGILGFYGWKLILLMYPQYQEIQQGFTYNGHTYISFFVLLSLGVLFGIYYKFSKKINVANLLIAPLIFWILINIGVAIYLKGAAFFIIPVFLGLLSLWILIRKDRPNLILLTIIGSIAIFIFAPLVQFFPVGLGLKMLVGSCLFTALLFGILLPVIGFYKFKKILAMLFVMVASLFFIKAHLSSNFSPNRQKPNSLVYYHDADNNKNYWATYDQELDDWTKEYLGNSPEPASSYISYASGSKYAKGYKFANVAPNKNIPIFKTVLHKDTVINQYKEVSFTIFPQRAVNQISLYTAEEVNFKSLSFNGQFFPLNNNLTNAAQKIKSKELVRYYVSDKDSLVVSYEVSKNQKVSFTVLEYSYDLLNHPEFTINKRADYMMPKPFIVTDAVIVKKELNMEDLITF